MNTEIKGDKLIITIDVSKSQLERAPLSKSGKSRVVATTNGFTAVGPVKIGLNVIC